MIWTPESEMDKQRLLVWLRERLPIEDFGPATAIGIVRPARGLIAGAVWHNFRGSNIEVSFAADDPRWATRQTVSFVLGYPFWYIGVRRVTAITQQKNKRARKLLEGLGFKREGVLIDLFPNDNGIIFGMTRRWFRRSKWERSIANAALESAAATGSGSVSTREAEHIAA